ncbi:MAG: hypothetical protein JXQ72_07395 [Anaerolineae bacterium]|nr:hypothetical protein [Anaerolineae bacterium]
MGNRRFFTKQYIAAARQQVSGGVKTLALAPAYFYRPPSGAGLSSASTPPVYSPPPPPKPPPGKFRKAKNSYDKLRDRARNNSMSWWGLKIVQGLLFGCGLALFGVTLGAPFLMLDGVECFASIGLVFVLASTALALRYILAPITCQWLVTVPEGEYYVLEDYEHFTLEYLESGRLIIPWRLNTRVVPYVKFKGVSASTKIEHVLHAQNIVVVIEVRATMSFNPARAVPQTHPRLRQMTRPEAFQNMIVGNITEAVHRHLQQLNPTAPSNSRPYVQTIESAVIEKLRGLEPMGLTLSGEYPVGARIHAPKRLDDAFQQAQQLNAARSRYDHDQSLRDIADLAARLGIPLEEVYRVYYLYQRVMPPMPSASSAPPVLRRRPPARQGFYGDPNQYADEYYIPPAANQPLPGPPPPNYPPADPGPGGYSSPSNAPRNQPRYDRNVWINMDRTQIRSQSNPPPDPPPDMGQTQIHNPPPVPPPSHRPASRPPEPENPTPVPRRTPTDPLLKRRRRASSHHPAPDDEN